MRTVLLVSYHFLPVHNVGVKQFASYCKYLPEFGWRAVVLSNDWSRGIPREDEGWGLSHVPELMDSAGEHTEIHVAAAEPYTNPLLSLHEALKRATGPTSPRLLRLALLPVRKALSTAWHFYGAYPDAFVGWARPATERGAELVRERRVDAILSNCPPQTNHLVASRLARRFRLPWVAYFGDLYGFYIGPGDWHGTARNRAIARRVHRRWLAPASSALAVSPRMTRLLERLYGLPGEVAVVGYDEADFPPRASVRREKLRISHAGSIYPGDQRPELFFDALDALLGRYPEARGELEVRFVGSKQEEWLRALVAERPCAAVTRIEPKVPPAEAVQLQRESDILLLFNLTAEQTAEGTLSYPSKVFEYFAAGRPVLALPADGDWVDTLLRTTRAGLTASSAAEAVEILDRWYRDWRDTGEIRYEGREEEIRSYSHRRQAALVARALDRAADRGAAHRQEF